MKRLVVIGGGESGVGAAMLGRQKGYDVFVTDFSVIKSRYKVELIEEEIPFEENGHTDALILNADLIIKSPGISDSVPIMQKVIKAGIIIKSEIDFAYEFVKGTVIAITGSNGKTTTASLVHHILNKAEKSNALVGNVGYSFARSVSEGSKDYYVVEISSFQLDDSRSFHPNVAVLLNITPDHLDRYPNIDAYIQSKFSLTNNLDTSDHFAYVIDDENIKSNFALNKSNANLYPISIKENVKVGAFASEKQLTIALKKKSILCRFMN